MAADGDRASCGHPNPVWYTDNRLWNEVVGGNPYAEAAGVICLECFILRAEDYFADKPMKVIGWRLIPDFGFPQSDPCECLGEARCVDHFLADLDAEDPALIDGSPDA